MTVFEDPELDHQVTIRLAPASHLLRVACNCGQVVGDRLVWTVLEAMAEWRKHLPDERAA